MAKLITILIFASLFLLPATTAAQTPSSQDGVDIVWESSSLAPAWYRGKALFTPENTLRFIAIPHLGDSAQNLIYKWRVNSTVLGNQSGIGRQTLTVSTGLLDERYTVEVEVTNQSGSVLAKNRITVERVLPELVVYENSLLSGLFHNIALNGEAFRMQEKEASFKAVPFFFNSNSYLGSLVYEWQINDSSVASTDNKATFGVEDRRGEAKIDVSVEHPRNILQQDNVTFNIIFDDESLFE